MVSSNQGPPLTKWLREWQQSGDNRLDDRLLDALYLELRQVAAHRLARESQATITPTELVHETWLRLKPPEAPITDRSGFLRLASVAMRHLLVDQARERLSRRRRDAMHAITVSMTPGNAQRTLDDTQLLDLDRALDNLAAGHPRVAEAVTLRAFGGLDLNELADTLRISLATAKRDLAFGRAWLTAMMREPAA